MPIPIRAWGSIQQVLNQKFLFCVRTHVAERYFAKIRVATCAGINILPGRSVANLLGRIEENILMIDWHAKRGCVHY